MDGYNSLWSLYFHLILGDLIKSYHFNKDLSSNEAKLWNNSHPECQDEIFVFSSPTIILCSHIYPQIYYVMSGGWQDILEGATMLKVFCNHQAFLTKKNSTNKSFCK